MQTIAQAHSQTVALPAPGRTLWEVFPSGEYRVTVTRDCESARSMTDLRNRVRPPLTVASLMDAVKVDPSSNERSITLSATPSAWAIIRGAWDKEPGLTLAGSYVAARGFLWMPFDSADRTSLLPNSQLKGWCGYGSSLEQAIDLSFGDKVQAYQVAQRTAAKQIPGARLPIGVIEPTLKAEEAEFTRGWMADMHSKLEVTITPATEADRRSMGTGYKKSFPAMLTLLDLEKLCKLHMAKDPEATWIDRLYLVPEER